MIKNRTPVQGREARYLAIGFIFIAGLVCAGRTLAAPSCTHSEGNQTFPGSSTVTVQIEGTANNCTAVDRTNTEFTEITVAGVLTLGGGTLEVLLGNGFVPAAGDSFDIFDFGSLSGAFGSVNFAAAVLPAPLYWELDTLHIDGTLSVAARAESDPVPALVDAIDENNLLVTVTALTATPRYTQVELLAAENYIRGVLTGLGYVVEPGDTITSFFDGRQSTNIVANLPGTTLADEIVVIGAHYDSVPGVAGADDNASGVAGLLEVARILAGQSFKRTIRFIAFTFEESFEGSFDYAPKVSANNENIIAMLNLESIGYTCENCQTPFSDVPPCLWVNPDGVTAGTGIAATLNNASTPLLDTLLRARTSYVPDLFIFSGTVAGTGECFPDTRRSDHYAFWIEGFPALMLNDTANFRNPNYHLPTDTIDTLDFGFMAKVTRATLATAVMLAEQVRYLGVAAPDFVDRAFGPDGRWHTADDYFATGINPLGVASGFRSIEPSVFAPPGGVFLGYLEEVSFAIPQLAEIGSNRFIGGRSVVRSTLFLDEGGLTPTDPPIIYQQLGELELDPARPSTLDIAPNNVFSSNRLFRYIGTGAGFPLAQHLGGWYLINGQSPSDVFAEQPDLIAHFDAVIAHLPTDWQIVFTERFTSDDPNVPGSLALTNLTFYSNDAAAVPAGAIVDPQAEARAVPIHWLAVAMLALCLGSLALVRDAFRDRLLR